VSSEGPRKAALLLSGLEPRVAAELLKSASSETVAKVAAELAYLDATGQKPPGAADQYAREFCATLQERKMQSGAGQEAFVHQLIENVVGQQDAQQMLKEVEQMVWARDPFLSIRSMDAGKIAGALKGEGANVASLVLSELPPKKSAKLLGLLDEDIRNGAIESMAMGDEVPTGARQRVAAVVSSRLEERPDSAVVEEVEEEEEQEDQPRQLRKVALVLRGLEKELQDTMLGRIAEKNQQIETQVRDLMVTWEDIAVIGERPLQEALRAVDARKLALAVSGADEEATSKIRENISERMRAMLDEELSLLSSPKMEEIVSARESILAALREMNKNGELSFIEEQTSDA